MAKHKPTQQMFGQIMRQPLSFKKDTKTGIDNLDEAILWLSQNVSSFSDLNVAKEGIPLMMIALNLEGTITVCHEDQAMLESIRQSFRFHRIKNALFLPKSIKALPTRLKSIHDGFMALDLTTENSILKVLSVAENSSSTTFHMLLSFKKTLLEMLDLTTFGTILYQGEYELANETFSYYAFTKVKT